MDNLVECARRSALRGVTGPESETLCTAIRVYFAMQYRVFRGKVREGEPHRTPTPCR